MKNHGSIRLQNKVIIADIANRDSHEFCIVENILPGYYTIELGTFPNRFLKEIRLTHTNFKSVKADMFLYDVSIDSGQGGILEYYGMSDLQSNPADFEKWLLSAKQKIIKYLTSICDDSIIFLATKGAYPVYVGFNDNFEIVAIKIDFSVSNTIVDDNGWEDFEEIDEQDSNLWLDA